MVGAVIIRQTRLQAPSPETSTNGSDLCGLQNSAIAQYSSTADPTLGLSCLKEELDSSFFGIDPVFTPFSSLYQGKVDPFDFYNVSEFANIESKNPFGFFPHKYDPISGGTKGKHLLVSSETENFLVFLDERISGKHAQNLITYLVDGRFIDEKTQEVSVEMNTLNSGNKVLCKLMFTFKFEVISSKLSSIHLKQVEFLNFFQIGGGIYWDYHISSVPINTDKSTAYTILSITSMAFLAMNVLSEVSGLLNS